MSLFEFQRDVLKDITRNLEQKPIVILHGDEGTGKSITLQYLKEFSIGQTKFKIFNCKGSIENKYRDFSCISDILVAGFNREKGQRELRNSIYKDITSTIGNLTKIGLENIVDNFLSKGDMKDFELFFAYIISESHKFHSLFIFDGLSLLDYKSYLLLYALLIFVSENPQSNIRIVIAIDSKERENYSFLSKLNHLHVYDLQMNVPTNNDLSNFIEPPLYEIGRHIPIKILQEIRDQIKDIAIFLNEKLENLVPNSSLAQTIVFSMSIFENPMTFSDISLFTNNYDDYETFKTLHILIDLHLISKQSDEYNDYYEISKVYCDTILKHIPAYLLANKLQLYINYLENGLDFDYFRKFQIYKKIDLEENAFVNAILAYCSYARGTMIFSADEIMVLQSFLNNSYYSEIFNIIEKGYSLFRKEEYTECYKQLSDFLANHHFITNKDIRFYAYSPEFIIEMIYLKALSSLRVTNIPNESLILQRDSLLLILKRTEHTNNEELKLRIKEVMLLIEIKLSNESTSYYFDSYFSICSIYKNKIRQSNVRSLIYWELRYATQLLRINSISGVPNKRIMLNEGFKIVEKHRLIFPDIYLRAACNYACDILWRGEYEESYKILEKSFYYIKANNIISRWGVIIQMYTFAALFSCKDSRTNLLNTYKELVWDNVDVNERMHERYLCMSNYAILLASDKKYLEAYEVLQNALTKCPRHELYELFILTTNLGAIEYMLGNSEAAIECENECTQMIESKNIPNFSKPFLYKRNMLLLDIYNKETVVNQIDCPLAETQTLSTGYNSDNYTRLMLFSDINYWAN